VTDEAAFWHHMMDQASEDCATIRRLMRAIRYLAKRGHAYDRLMHRLHDAYDAYWEERDVR